MADRDSCTAENCCPQRLSLPHSAPSQYCSVRGVLAPCLQVPGSARSATPVMALAAYIQQADNSTGHSTACQIYGCKLEANPSVSCYSLASMDEACIDLATLLMELSFVAEIRCSE